MTGWNLPPGVSVNDLPGNSDKDIAHELWINDRIDDPDCNEWAIFLDEIGEELGFSAPLQACSGDLFLAMKADPVALSSWENWLENQYYSGGGV